MLNTGFRKTRYEVTVHATAFQLHSECSAIGLADNNANRASRYSEPKAFLPEGLAGLRITTLNVSVFLSTGSMGGISR